MRKDPPQVLVLDHNRHNLTLLTQFLNKQGYEVLPTLHLEEVVQALNSATKINLALLDISGLDSDIWTVCQQLHQQEIPFLVISPRHHAAIQQASIAHGALGLLNKPLVMREFLHLVRELLK